MRDYVSLGRYMTVPPYGCPNYPFHAIGIAIPRKWRGALKSGPSGPLEPLWASQAGSADSDAPEAAETLVSWPDPSCRPTMVIMFH